MKMKIRLKQTSYLWLLFACVSLLATVYLTYHYFSVRDSLLDKAREYGRQKTINASHELRDRKSTRLNSSHIPLSRMPSSA